MTAWGDFKPRQTLQVLTARGVDFVIIGGYAAVLHGSPRLTQDLDVCYSTERANLDVLGRVLLDLNARPAGLEDDVPFSPDAAALRRVELLTLDTDLGRLDVMTRPAGSPTYGRLRARADSFDLDGLVVRVASLGDLLAMKRAAGRAKDLADVEELEAIRRLGA